MFFVLLLISDGQTRFATKKQCTTFIISEYMSIKIKFHQGGRIISAPTPQVVRTVEMLRSDIICFGIVQTVFTNWLSRHSAEKTILIYEVTLGH